MLSLKKSPLRKDHSNSHKGDHSVKNLSYIPAKSMDTNFDWRWGQTYTGKKNKYPLVQ